MADDSPGKVQALRAIFSEKSNPVMGMMPSGSAIKMNPDQPWHSSLNSSAQDTTTPKKFSELRLGHKVLPVPDKSPFLSNSIKPPVMTRSSIGKPTVGPKPPHLLQQFSKTSESSNANGSSAVQQRPLNESKTKAFGETIASFMFASNKENVCSNDSDAPPLPKPRMSLQNFPAGVDQCISSDNYVCRIRRRELPPQEKLGPAPFKTIRPAHLKLPSTPAPRSSILRPPYPCPPRPMTPPPLPPVIIPPSLWEEIEELYEDTLLGEGRRPVSLIPEYTEEEEQAELYHDAAEDSSSLQYTKPPPPIPSSEYLQPNVNSSTEELYQDADGTRQEEFYEVMPCDEIPEDVQGSPLYSNSKREIEKMRKEEEKRMRREHKEREKREKEMEKLRRKFGLTGEEIPIDDGLVKWDSRGGRGGDLPVKKGETVLILRMEGNPSGRWLVKNEKGKIGYVELTNIEVDPLSVKSVMSIRRLSVISAGEELYCEAKSEEEAIYEVTY